MRSADGLQPGFAQAGLPWLLSPRELLRPLDSPLDCVVLDEFILDDGPSGSHLCKTNQHFVYLKSQNEVIV